MIEYDYTQTDPVSFKHVLTVYTQRYDLRKTHKDVGVLEVFS